MITCYIEYQIDPYQLAEFRSFCEAWIPIIESYGGTHHGYFLPRESASDVAIGLFSFPSLAAYEQYREQCKDDPEAKRASKIAADTRCIVRLNRQFLEPLLPENQRA